MSSPHGIPKDVVDALRENPPHGKPKQERESTAAPTKPAKETTAPETRDPLELDPYDQGYEDMYEDDYYDEDRYEWDDEYAQGVDDAMADLEAEGW